MARDRGITVSDCDRRKLDAMSVTHAHQGVIAVCAVREYASIDDIFNVAAERGEQPFVVVCDEISDPHNLGAIIRSAECAGAHGVIVPERQGRGADARGGKGVRRGGRAFACGARGKPLAPLETLKTQGLWVIAADAHGEKYTQLDLSGPLALVIGSEGEGISRLVLEKCDARAALPVLGKIDSLNASVAAGVLLYEVRRQRG